MSAPADEGWTGGWTGALRRRAVRRLPPEKLLPDTQPAYMASWIYVFGVLTVAALIAVLVSGGWLALEGPAWWHTSDVGHYVNSLHLWGVELFMFFMVVHLWGKFLMAAWRGRRGLTWVIGVIAFLASVGTAFTGYLVQQNFDSQWIAGQAKDGLNAVGIGAYFNVADFGQMLMWHIVLLPVVLGVLTVWHILLVRRHGIVPPIGATAPEGPEGDELPAEAPEGPGGTPEAPGASGEVRP
ncbi:cytochrome b N-terminal domain-containing protein [Phaeacidiphilus oryzae]|uniref:cytochrome b N-terminal domain-containing protein n=1 Tax=Phaeacidiphilus oryzae TaxID=348818 RepID=UPI0007C86AFF|nr:cytochrome b N-terminal domain-containing protein [Phaeacidiphilus oryzae]